VIQDPSDARVRSIIQLSQKDARFETGLFLLEGPQGLKELVESPELAHEIFATELAQERYDNVLTDLESEGIKVTLVSERVMTKISDTKTPQGIVSVLSHLDVTLEELLASEPKLLAILDKARDPGNAGTVLRAADAAGADGIIFTKESVDLYNPKVVRSTAGSILHLPSVINQDPVQLIAELQKRGIQVFAAASGGVLINQISDEVMAKPTAWIFGNEAHGIAEDLLELCDQVVALPIYGSAESLNLATAASVCLYASAFQMNSNR
jgi:TrmH family RNA methyltransferase